VVFLPFQAGAFHGQFVIFDPVFFLFFLSVLWISNNFYLKTL